MKRILLGTLAALGTMTGLSSLESRLLGHNSYLNTDPRAARHWHNPADPVQAARIEAAVVKRERKSLKLRNDAQESYFRNVCHQHCSNVLSLDTTYTY